MVDEKTFLKELGQKIRKARLEKGVTQEQLALDSGMDRAFISEIENGHKNPSVLSLKKIQLVLGEDFTI